MSVRARKCKQALRYPKELLGFPVDIVGGGHPRLDEVETGVMTPRRWRKTRHTRPFKFRCPGFIYFLNPEALSIGWIQWMDEKQATLSR